MHLRLGAYLLVAVVVLGVVIFLSVRFSPPMDTQGAIEIAKSRMEADYTRSDTRPASVDCIASAISGGAIEPGDDYDVTCSMLRGSQLVARTTFYFGPDGLGGHEKWDLDGVDDE